MSESARVTAFLGHRRIARGSLAAVALALKARSAEDPMPLVFDDRTGRAVDLDWRGSDEEIARRYGEASPIDEADPASRPPAPGRGRPKLGVVAREVTLLPRHWEWLNGQPGGASVALRKLVEVARKGSEWDDHVRRVREAANRFLSAMAGDLPGYEEATRALFSGDRAAFERFIEDWPADIRDHARAMADGAFA
ncbi:DUF2239 family protein [Prosthecomicrobium sp. N25]|uniref:DUF2239 family protein n=1 Tax=Prosthecomicrobium sp. N25 TaxID=3129254 RepID=UPI003077902B